jgi:hypothetical protein
VSDERREPERGLAGESADEQQAALTSPMQTPAEQQAALTGSGRSADEQELATTRAGDHDEAVGPPATAAGASRPSSASGGARAAGEDTAPLSTPAEAPSTSGGTAPLSTPLDTGASGEATTSGPVGSGEVVAPAGGEPPEGRTVERVTVAGTEPVGEGGPKEKAQATAADLQATAQSKAADLQATAQAKAADLQATAQAKAADLQATAQARVAGLAAKMEERPELIPAVGFAGGLVLAFVLKRLVR